MMTPFEKELFDLLKKCGIIKTDEDKNWTVIFEVGGNDVGIRWIEKKLKIK